MLNNTCAKLCFFWDTWYCFSSSLFDADSLIILFLSDFHLVFLFRSLSNNVLKNFHVMYELILQMPVVTTQSSENLSEVNIPCNGAVIPDGCYLVQIYSGTSTKCHGIDTEACGTGIKS